jgi:tRNA U54 and U55 pseudouridine synthase Pus10
MIHTTLFVCLLALIAVSSLFSMVDAKKKKNEPDPRDCEVCINNLNAIDALLKPEEKNDKLAIRKAIGMQLHGHNSCP